MFNSRKIRTARYEAWKMKLNKPYDVKALKLGKLYFLSFKIS